MLQNEKLNQLSEGYKFYEARRREYDNGNKSLNFRVSPEPLKLKKSENEDIINLGPIVVQFLKLTQDLYESDERVQSILNTGKPAELLNCQKPNYLFARPDFILTPEGLKICEIETSIFGLGVSHLLGQSYHDTGHETLHDQNSIRAYLDNRMEKVGNLIYSNKTQAYAGQLEYTANKIFSNGKDSNWSANHIDNLNDQQTTVYRGFYLSESLNDLKVKSLIQNKIIDNNTAPSITPQMEEKAILALIYDTRFEGFYRDNLGVVDFDKLREHIPPTWIVGQEKYFSKGMPNGINSSLELANQTVRNRQFILKSSGFSETASWAEGVHLLQDKSRIESQRLIQLAIDDKTCLYIVQQFDRGEKRICNYESEDGEKTLDARWRITPYYRTDTGELLTGWATGCEKTDSIHTTSTSINTSFSKQSI
jgi:hypothetical protein